MPKSARARRHDTILWYAKQAGSHCFNADPIRQPYAETTIERFSHYIGNIRGGTDFGQQALNPIGKHPDDVITNIQPIAPSAKARIGYPTQKPVELLESILLSSSNPGDLVLDPFCGCATACIAAEKLDRQWVGIDISPKAADLVKLRLHNEIGLFGQGTHRTDIPMRTDLGVLPNYRTHKHTLFGMQEGNCAGCQVMFPFRNMTVNHIVPQSKGGAAHRENLQLLCNACNSMKATGTQEAFIAKLKENGIRD